MRKLFASILVLTFLLLINISYADSTERYGCFEVTWKPVYEGVVTYNYSVKVTNICNNYQYVQLKFFVDNTNFDKKVNFKIYKLSKKYVTVEEPFIDYKSMTYNYSNNPYGISYEDELSLFGCSSIDNETFSCVEKVTELHNVSTELLIPVEINVTTEKIGNINLASFYEHFSRYETKEYVLNLKLPYYIINDSLTTSGRVGLLINGHVYHPWWNTSWTNRIPIYVTKDYSIVRLNITYKDGMKPDFSDLRFTRFNNNFEEVPTPFRIMYYEPSKYAIVYLDSLTSKFVYMYYGNPYASPPNYLPFSNAIRVRSRTDCYIFTGSATQIYHDVYKIFNSFTESYGHACIKLTNIYEGTVASSCAPGSYGDYWQSSSGPFFVIEPINESFGYIYTIKGGLHGICCPPWFYVVISRFHYSNNTVSYDYRRVYSYGRYKLSPSYNGEDHRPQDIKIYNNYIYVVGSYRLLDNGVLQDEDSFIMKFDKNLTLINKTVIDYAPQETDLFLRLLNFDDRLCAIGRYNVNSTTTELFMYCFNDSLDEIYNSTLGIYNVGINDVEKISDNEYYLVLTNGDIVSIDSQGNVATITHIPGVMNIEKLYNESWMVYVNGYAYVYDANFTWNFLFTAKDYPYMYNRIDSKIPTTFPANLRYMYPTLGIFMPSLFLNAHAYQYPFSCNYTTYSLNDFYGNQSYRMKDIIVWNNVLLYNITNPFNESLDNVVVFLNNLPVYANESIGFGYVSKYGIETYLPTGAFNYTSLAVKIPELNNSLSLKIMYNVSGELNLLSLFNNLVYPFEFICYNGKAKGGIYWSGGLCYLSGGVTKSPAIKPPIYLVYDFYRGNLYMTRFILKRTSDDKTVLALIPVPYGYDYKYVLRRYYDNGTYVDLCSSNPHSYTYLRQRRFKIILLSTDLTNANISVDNFPDVTCSATLENMFNFSDSYYIQLDSYTRIYEAIFTRYLPNPPEYVSNYSAKFAISSESLNSPPDVYIEFPYANSYTNQKIVRLIAIDDKSTILTINLYLNNTLIYTNGTYLNGTVLSIPLPISDAGDYVIYATAFDGEKLGYSDDVYFHYAPFEFYTFLKSTFVDISENQTVNVSTTLENISTSDTVIEIWYDYATSQTNPVNNTMNYVGFDGNYYNFTINIPCEQKALVYFNVYITNGTHTYKSGPFGYVCGGLPTGYGDKPLTPPSGAGSYIGHPVLDVKSFAIKVPYGNCVQDSIVVELKYDWNEYDGTLNITGLNSFVSGYPRQITVKPGENQYPVTVCGAQVGDHIGNIVVEIPVVSGTGTMAIHVSSLSQILFENISQMINGKLFILLFAIVFLVMLK